MVELLEINSKPYGKVKVSNEQRFHFTEGLLGFDTLKDYYLLDQNEGPFYWLQSVDDIDIAFVVINPQFFKIDYQLEIEPQELKKIGFLNDKEIEENLLHFVIVTIPPDNPNDMTANFLGPIIINKATHIGKQALSLNTNYTVRHPILEELEKQSSEGD